jgi:hypothetical protein
VLTNTPTKRGLDALRSLWPRNDRPVLL